jgi:hypothetical protein
LRIIRGFYRLIGTRDREPERGEKSTMVEDNWFAYLIRRAEEVSGLAERTFEDLDKAQDFPDFFVRLGGGVASLGNYALNNKNICIFGPTGAGKTSLIGFLKTGKAVVETHDPTAGLALVDRRFEIDKAEWLNVHRDAGGERAYRHFWPQVTKIVDPDAVIYVLDGRKSL